MKKVQNNIKIVSTGKYVPDEILSNFDLEKIVDTSDAWIRSRTGIERRRIAKEQETSDMAYLAAKDAIDRVGYDATQIDVIIVATFTPDYMSPAVSNLIQAKLGLNDYPICCFDINAACTGSIYAINIAAQMLSSNNYRSILIVGAEKISKCLDFADRDTCVLFGDGAGAMIIEASNEEKPAYFYTASKGDLEKAIYVDRYVHMDGQRVYQFATRAIEASITNVLQQSNLSIDDVHKIIPHQANVRILQNAAKNLNFSMEKYFINIAEYGNTSAASILIALNEYLSTLSNIDNQKILLVGFGAGFTWGSALLTL